MKVTVKLLTRFVSPLLHVPDTYIDVSSMSAMAQSCNTDQNYTFLEAWTRPFFFFCNPSTTRYFERQCINHPHSFSQANWATTLLPKKRIAITFSMSMLVSFSSSAAKIINTFYTTQVHVARNTSMKRKKSVDFKSRSWSSRGYDHSLSYVLT